MDNLYYSIRTAWFKKIYPAQTMYRPGKDSFDEIHKKFYILETNPKINIRNDIKNFTPPHIIWI